ncbi:hypothetical protein ABHI18_001372 [Aspergillus niger]
MPPSPLYTPQDVPSFKKRRNRLPNTRAKQLLRAAERDYNDPPPPPGLGECCGSSCDPCVNDLWKEELAIWRERWGDGAVEDGGSVRATYRRLSAKAGVENLSVAIRTSATAEDLPNASFARRVPSLQAASFGRLRRPITHKKRDDKSFIVIYGNSQAPTRNAPASKAERFALVLGDPELLQLARWVCTIETGYSCPMEMEYAKDSLTNESFIVQSRPETVHSRRDATAACKADAALSVRLCLVVSAYEMDKFFNACVLVTATTDPEWVPIMKRAAAIVTDHGGRTSHATIVANSVFLSYAREGSAQGRVWAADYVMFEIPPSAVLAEQLAAHFDGSSIWSNDLTQLTSGNDSDSDELAELFDEQGEAAKTLVARVIRVARRAGCKVGICGQAPSYHPEFARFLVEVGFDSVSVIPDSFVNVKRQVVTSEQKQNGEKADESDFMICGDSK